MIQNRELKKGQVLVARHKGQDFKAEVIEGEDGKYLLKFPDGTIHKSVSSAGTAVTGGAINGWNFWSVEGGESGEKTEPVRTRRSPRKTKVEKTESKGKNENSKNDDDAVSQDDTDGKIEDGEAARIHCEECDLNFADSVKASEHFNEVHSAA